MEYQSQAEQGQERIPSPYSPKELTPGTETLAPDQRFMGVFKLVEFEQNCLRDTFALPRNGFGLWMGWLLPWGDLFMMRKQFLMLKHLAQRDRGLPTTGNPPSAPLSPRAKLPKSEKI